MLEVPINRITTLNDEQPNMDAPYVLYWMIAFRRVNYNFSLQRACLLYTSDAADE